MAAPKYPNTAAATVAVRRKAQERKATELRGAGWTVTPPPATPEARPGTTRRVRLELTSGELEALLTMCTSAEAGDLGELMGHARRYAAALRALNKVRGAAREWL
jgi:hypothetical protein